MITLLLVIPMALIAARLIWGEDDSYLELTGLLFIIMLIGVLTECSANAKEYKLLDVDSVNISTSRFGCNREPMTPHYDCKDYVGRIGSEFNLRLLEHGYWNNYVHTEGLESQVKTVGWQWEMGLKFTPYLDVFYQHHSRHVMEGDQPIYVDPYTEELRRSKFPVTDEYGVRLKFYTNPKPARSLFE